ncbi:MAG TPA: T9SS type A sorting domain-containing protein [Flavitalea sp.]|nr:T9SS type A sorting domain-containing protein [Flavitalea sp.]
MKSFDSVDDLQKAALATAIALLLFLSSNAQGLVFNNYVLESGTAGNNNCVYRFKLVSAGVDALVKIKQRSAPNIIVEDIDVSDFGWDKAFQPRIGPSGGLVSGNTNWWMDFEISFVKSTTTDPMSVSSFDVTALDVDGDGYYIREYVEMYKADAYLVETVSLLSITNLNGEEDDDDDKGNGKGKRFVGPMTNFLNIDTLGTQVMATTKYKNKNKVTVRIGATKTGAAQSDAAYRYNSIWFKTFNYTAARFLPIKLTAFTAQLENKKVLLQWSTSTEKDASHFVIERSTDGVVFSDAALLFTEGNSSQARSYRYADAVNSIAPVLYYRLRLVDLDGKYTFSSTRVIHTRQTDVGKVLIYPNPIINDVRITIPNDWQKSKITYQLTRADGQVMSEWTALNASQTEVSDLSKLASGIYLIKVTNGKDAITQKIVKSR